MHLILGKRLSYYLCLKKKTKQKNKNPLLLSGPVKIFAQNCLWIVTPE